MKSGKKIKQTYAGKPAVMMTEKEKQQALTKLITGLAAQGLQFLGFGGREGRTLLTQKIHVDRGRQYHDTGTQAGGKHKYNPNRFPRYKKENGAWVMVHKNLQEMLNAERAAQQ